MGLFKRRRVWWMDVFYNGRRYRRSTHSSNRKLAQAAYDQVQREILRDEMPGIIFDDVTVDELAEDFLRDYRVKARRSLEKAERNVGYLKAAFGGMQARQITTEMVNHYIDQKLDKGLAPATINRQLAALKHMFHLALRCTPPKVYRVPYIPMLKEDNIREGFFEHVEYLRLRDVLPGYLKPVITFAYHTGWRKSEILNLVWDRVDLNLGTVRLGSGETKNDEPRMIYLDDELMKDMLTLYMSRGQCPYVFHHDGERILKFEKAWNAACRRAGLVGKLFHDLRRTAVRNMVRAGVPERVGMRVSGHKTRNVFERYNIVNGQDLKEAARKHLNFINSQNEAMKEKIEAVTNLPQSPIQPSATDWIS